MRRAALILIVLSTLTLHAATAQAEPAHPQGTVLAGAAAIDITPEVAEYEDRDGDGAFTMGDPTEPFGFGDRVISFADGDGRILVGNGRGPAEYIYNRLWARALVLRDANTGTTIAIVSVDLYMITNADAQAIRAAVDPSLGIDYVLVAATHNHMGPDTLGMMGLYDADASDVLRIAMISGEAPSGINGEWFDKMSASCVRAIESAASDLRPARLIFAQTGFGFGVIDAREPIIIDDTLTVMALDGLDGRPIATLMSWACHPESVLTYGKEPIGPGSEPLTDEQRSAWGKVLTSGFPGYACEFMEQRRKGTALYVNGPIGGMITNLWTYVWDPELHPEYPASADLASVPEDLRIPNDFRFEAVQGRELAKAGLAALLESGEIADNGTIEFKRAEVLVPLQNQVLRLAASLGMLGRHERHLYDDQWHVDAMTAPWLSGLFTPAVKVAHGANLKTEAAVLRIGPSQIAAVPAELLPELSVGLPEDFHENQARYFPNEIKRHAHGDKYKLLHPCLKAQMTQKYKMVVCLANDDLGYVIPECDFNPPHDVKLPPLAWWWICLDSDANPHYEESMSAGRYMERTLMGALTMLLSGESGAEGGGGADSDH